MAVMNEQQQELLNELEAARASYEAYEARLMQDLSDAKWAAKQDIRHLVREAREAGVPYRQIGFALKTGDHRTIKDYEQDIRRTHAGA